MQAAAHIDPKHLAIPVQASYVLCMANQTTVARRVAVYLRVSSDKQTVENQRGECEQLAVTRGEVVRVYEEQGSAAKRRPVFDEVLADARRGEFDVLVVWAIDRFGRSMVGNLQDVLELDRIGVEVVSVRETWLATQGPTRNLLVGVFSWVAEQERAQLVERTKAGLRRAARHGTRSGKRVGRPIVHVDVEMAREIAARHGGSVRAASREMGVALGTLQRALERKPVRV